MTRDEIETFLEKWSEAMKRHDAVALAAACSVNGTYTSMLAGTVTGRQGIESVFRGWFSAFPEMIFEVEGNLIDGTRAAVIWSQRGRHLGDFCGLAGTGRVFQLYGVFLLDLTDGQIVSMRSIYDFTGLLLQLGVLKAKPAI